MASIDEAFHELDAALTRLEAAVTRRVEAERARGDRDVELALMAEDRARLAAELDAAGARLARMTAATGDVAHRIDRAIGTVAGVLAERTVQPED